MESCLLSSVFVVVFVLLGFTLGARSFYVELRFMARWTQEFVEHLHKAGLLQYGYRFLPNTHVLNTLIPLIMSFLLLIMKSTSFLFCHLDYSIFIISFLLWKGVDYIY